MYREELSNVSPDLLKQECTKMFKSLWYEIHELIFVEESTWNQNRSTTWYEQRIECITGAIAHKTSSIISTSLIKRICQSQYQPINSAALKWGREHETLALNYCKSVMLDTCLPSKPKLICNVRKHVNFECTSIGLVIDNEYACLGASPDATFHCSCCNFGALESSVHIPWGTPYSHKSFMIKKGFYITYKSGLSIKSISILRKFSSKCASQRQMFVTLLFGHLTIPWYWILKETKSFRTNYVPIY